MANYDCQLVISLPSGTDRQQKAVRNGAEHFAKKARLYRSTGEDKILDNLGIVEWKKTEGKKLSPITKYVQATICSLAKLTDKSRLVIIGHGDTGSTTVGGANGDELADAIVYYGLEAAPLIVFVSCLAGAESTDPFKRLLKGTDVEFRATAKLFHRRLGKCNIFAKVHARTGIVFMGPEGRKTTLSLEDHIANLKTESEIKKAKSQDERNTLKTKLKQPEPKAAGSKVVYGWDDNGNQTETSPY